MHESGCEALSFALEEVYLCKDLTMRFFDNLVANALWDHVQELFTLGKLLLVFFVLDVSFDPLVQPYWNLV